MKPLGLGIIGLHHQHARWYHAQWQDLPQYEVRAVAEADEDFLKTENEFFSLDSCSDYKELLARDDIDAVIIWLPHSQMPDCVELAAQAGKHIIVEKPCCADIEDAKKILHVSEIYPHIKISAPYCWRNHLVAAEIKKLLDDKEIGEIKCISARLNAGSASRYVRDNQLWMLRKAEGGGPMWNLGVHWIDFIRWATGCEFSTVSGTTAGPCGKPERTIEDAAHAVMTLDSGACVSLQASYAVTPSYPGARDIAINFCGSKGSINWQPAWQGNIDTLLVVREDEKLDQSERCQYLDIESPKFAGYCGHMSHAWLEDFANCVRENRQPQVTPKDILSAVKVADAFYKSVESGKAEAV